MARRWTPRRLIVMRRARIIACVLSISLTATSLFIFTAKKSVAMIVNGKTRIVSTYSTNPIRLLEEQHVPVKTHDQIISSSGDILTNHSTVTVRSAYQTSITVDGVTIPFWTVATSVDQLIGFFKANAKNASRITVNLQNIYDKLTCGLSINKKGPISVIADGKTRVVQNGDLPASAILDSQGIVLGKEDRVSVEEDDGNTVLRVSRVTHGKETRTVSLPFATQTVVDPKLPANSRVVQQVGVNGEREDVYNVTYVDGKAESATLVSQNLVKPAVNQVIAVGKAAPAPIHKNNTNTQKSKQSKQQTNAQHKKQNTEQPAKQEKKNSQQQTQQQTASAAPAPAANPPAPAPSSNPDSLVHATPEQAKLFAQGAAAQMGWTGKEWEDLLWLWNRESGWRWNAENPSSHAYGIPQALPGNKMSSAGANWHEDAAIQISWGLSYIKSKYKTPSGAVKHSREIGWY
ncbi:MULTISPECIES: G5 domain-containing protein [Gardnerella]|uniref:aggregation-promoting factor C-terminal-like domain-containing protein n=1 Tax=Gardnerella TaxID=2701 RepID=UPI0007E4B50C|nr:G5 domain-containing protein [Gardnerella sp. 26-12]PMC50580.1 G5 domain-containing protein [Gardnerella vaginalis]PMC54358.1 G5 domain-containing protein [Gardnerella vaginalis]